MRTPASRAFSPQMVLCGGERNNFEVEAIVYLGGTEFTAPDGEKVPFTLLTFKQR